MEPHFNGLSPAETERLALLIEEAGEVVQAATKILRHGYQSRHPQAELTRTNRQDLERELGHLLAAAGLATNHGDVDPTKVVAAGQAKLDQYAAGTYLHHTRLDASVAEKAPPEDEDEGLSPDAQEWVDETDRAM